MPATPDYTNFSATRKFAANVGDGSATSYAVVHNFNTRDVVVQIWDNNAPYNQIAPTSISATDPNTVTVVFGSAPALNRYRVLVRA